MQLKSLYLQNFRNYKESYFEFQPHINPITGPNAQGKTSILEAIYFLICGRSFRTSHFINMVRKGEEAFYIEANFIKHGVEQTLKILSGKKTRKIFYNSTSCPSFTSLLGLLQGVVMNPDDVALIKGAPIDRRHYLDIQIAQVDPLYVHHLMRYYKAMRQRNSLLRSRKILTIESWEREMAKSGAYLTEHRRKTVERLSLKGKELYEKLTCESEKFALIYKSSVQLENSDEIKEFFHHQFRKNRPREMEIGATMLGPHKDDILITIGQKDVRYFASEGQQRSCVGTLRFAEWEHLKAKSEELPLILIDDVGVSLDDSRKKRLFKHIQHLGQVFLTSTEEALSEWGNSKTELSTITS